MWLAGGLVAGAALLRTERFAFRARTVAAMHGEASMLRGMLDSGRKVLAGLLFILPGVVSDLFGARLADAADQRRARHAARAGVGRDRRGLAARRIARVAVRLSAWRRSSD